MASLLGLYSVAAAAPDYIALFLHGDSRVVDVQDRDPAIDTDIAGISQFVTGGTGLTSSLFPLQQAIAGDGHEYLSPFYNVAKRILADSGIKVDISGGGYNGQSVVIAGGPLGPGGATTAVNVAKAEAMYAARGSANPGAVIAPLIGVIEFTNDVSGGITPQQVHDAVAPSYASLRAATGFASAPVLAIGLLPGYISVRVATQSETIGTGDGSAAVFSYTLTNPPITSVSSITVNDVAIASLAIDATTGAITGTGIASGTLDWLTGDLSITFSSAPTSGHLIKVLYAGNRAAICEAALKIATLKETNAFYCAPPATVLVSGTPTVTTTDHLHESDQPAQRVLSYENYGLAALVALGQHAPRTPVFSAPSPFSVVGGSGSTLDLTTLCDQPVYYRSISVGGSFAELSGDVEFPVQKLRPVGGAWPAVDNVTPANNSRTISILYRTGDRVEGTLTIPLSIENASDIFNTIFDLHVDSPTAGVSEVLPCIAGKSYLIASWDGGGVTVVGEDSLVTEISGGLADPLRIFQYLPVSSGDKTFAPSPSTTILYVEEVTGKTFNGSRTGISMGDRSGSFVVPDEVTGAVFAVVCSSDGAPSINMTPVGITAAYFNGFTSNSDTTAAGAWSGFTGAVLVGMS